MVFAAGFDAGDACAYPEDAWFLSDPGNSGFPSDFMPCLDGGVLYPKCAGCACRQLQSATATNGTALSFVQCVIEDGGATCSATTCGDGSGSQVNEAAPMATTAAPATTAPAATTAAPAATTAAPVATTATPIATTAAPTATTETPLGTVAAAGASASGSGGSDATKTPVSSTSAPSTSASDSYNDWSDSSEKGLSVSNGSASSSSSHSVLVAVLIGVVLLVGVLLCLWICSSRKKRAEREGKAFGGAATATAQRTTAFGHQQPVVFPPRNSHVTTRTTRSNSRTTARSTLKSTPQSLPVIVPSQSSSSNGGSQVSGDSRSSGGSVFSASVTNNGAAAFTFNSNRQQRSLAPKPKNGKAPRRAPTMGQFEIAETKWSVYSDEQDRSTVGRGMSSMISDFSDIDVRSTQYDGRSTTASGMSFFSDDSEFDREATESERRREREF